jgi:hypothetical protein
LSPILNKKITVTLSEKEGDTTVKKQFPSNVIIFM